MQSKLTIKENNGIPFRSHLEHLLDFGSEQGSIDSEIFGLKIVQWAARVVGH
jgi:hypothetical protein